MAVDLEDYSLAQVIKGLHGTDYYTVATDADGNIVGVFKGEYNDELITIKTDSEGRMLAIITDPEDVYGNVHMVGNAELAARLGSIDTYERSGNILWMDDFEDNIDKWNLLVSDTTGSIALSTASARNGATSARLTTGPTADDYVALSKSLSFPVLGKFGLETSFTIAGDKEIIRFHLYLYSSGNSKLPVIEYDSENDTLRCQLGLVEWQTIATNLNLSRTAGLFHTMKLVCDFENGKYVELYLDNVLYPLTDIAIPTSGAITAPYLWIRIKYATNENASKTCYIDDVIVTQNED